MDDPIILRVKAALKDSIELWQNISGEKCPLKRTGPQNCKNSTTIITTEFIKVQDHPHLTNLLHRPSQVSFFSLFTSLFSMKKSQYKFDSKKIKIIYKIFRDPYNYCGSSCNKSYLKNWVPWSKKNVRYYVFDPPTENQFNNSRLHYMI